jgi:23S rRNA pseudouridine2605 synthase
MEERVQKILARAGYGSRRACEELIIDGRISINGVKAILGSKADQLKDIITVDGQALPRQETEKIYIALHKPRGVLSDTDPNDPRKTVFDLVEVPGHLFAVGRLDLDSEGLILLTNDGMLANRLTHPRYGHEKEYRVLVAARPDDDQLKAWRNGVVMEDGYRTQPAEVRVEQPFGKGCWLRIILREGRKRQIREVGSRIGLPVVRIIRIRIGSVLLDSLAVGKWRYLSPQEVRQLSELSGGRREIRMTRPDHRSQEVTAGSRKPLGTSRRPARTGEAVKGYPKSDEKRPTGSTRKPVTRGPGKPTGSTRKPNQSGQNSTRPPSQRSGGKDKQG